MIDIEVRAFEGVKPVLLILTQKKNYKVNGERSDGLPLNLVCSTEMEPRRFPKGIWGTIVDAP